MPRKPTKTDYLVLFSLGALWGSSFGAIKIALYGVSPLTVMSVRILIAGVALFFLTLISKSSFPCGIRNWNKILWIAIIGILMPFFLVPWGQQQINSSLASILMAVNPLFALTLGHFFSKNEVFTLQKLMSIIIGFIGILLVFGESAFSAPLANILPQLAVIFAGIGYTISGVISTRLVGVSANSLSSATFITASLIILPVWLIIEKPWNIKFEIESFLALIYLGLVTTGMAFLMRYYLILRAGAVFLSYVAFLIPMFGIFFGVFFLDESISLSTYIAVILILLGIFLGQK